MLNKNLKICLNSFISNQDLKFAEKGSLVRNTRVALKHARTRVKMPDVFSARTSCLLS